MNKNECEVTPETMAQLPDSPALFRLIKSDGKIIAHHETEHLRTSIQALHESYRKGGYEFTKIEYVPLKLQKPTLKSRIGFLYRKWQSAKRAWLQYREKPYPPEANSKTPYYYYWERGINRDVLDLIEPYQLRDHGTIYQKAWDTEIKPKLEELLKKKHYRKEYPDICKNCLRLRICEILPNMAIGTLHSGDAYPDNFIQCDKCKVGREPMHCPICDKSDRITIALVNCQNRTHYYELTCWHCDWKQYFPFSFSYLEDSPSPSQHKKDQLHLWDEYQKWCNDLLINSGYYKNDPKWWEKLQQLLPKKENR